MATQDVFNPDSFSLTTLTAAILALPHIPSQIGQAGLFEYSGVSTLTVQLEREGYSVKLIDTSARGAPGKAIGRTRRDTRSFVVPHLQLNDQILADEVQGVRMFGSENAADTIDNAINKVLRIGQQSFDLTMEYHRLNALSGVLLDADGSVLYDFFSEFGVDPITVDFQLDADTTNIRAKCDEVANAVQDELGNLPYTGLVAYCGRNYWSKFITHPSVEKTYLNQSQAAELRGQTEAPVDFGGIRWVKYRGAVNSSQMLPTNECRIVPVGVPGLLLGRFAPGDWLDTVNTIGLPSYARGTIREDGKGADIEMQSNPLHIVTRPRAILRGTI